VNNRQKDKETCLYVVDRPVLAVLFPEI